jgi:CheY-like chemotaxis protein
MQALGQLTGGIAHDFSNMLTAVLGNLDLLNRSLEPGSRAAQRASIALQGAVRCSDLTRRLLYFARQKPLQRGVVDLNAVVEGMADIFEQTLDDSIEIELRPGPTLWSAMAEKSHLESSLLNLVINARDALPDGGRIVVETANATVDHAVDDGNFRADAGDYAMLSVSDNGTGMPGTVLARIFEPFFTTKEPGHGTGLGLSMIYSFVQECGGFMTVDSAPGRGTTIRLYLKRWEAVPDAASDPAAAHPRAQDGETVLVVEDDVEVLHATADSLRELGYAVVEAANGAAALDLLADGRRVDVLFTDIAMPGGMNGWQLAKAAAERHPALAILYTSGYTDRAIGGGRDASAELLHKPYRDYELAEAIRRVLDGASTRSAGEIRLS